MRQISAQLLDSDSLLELKAGQRLEIVVGNKTIAEIVPLTTSDEGSQLWTSEEERLRAGDRLLALMRKGYDLSRFKIVNRDELYDRG